MTTHPRPVRARTRKPETVLNELATFEMALCVCGPLKHEPNPGCLAFQFNCTIEELRRSLRSQPPKERP